MNTNEKCLLNFISYANSALEGADCLINFLNCHNRKIKCHNLNPVFDIIDEMEFSNYNIVYEQENLD